jgi:hypothetical protein
LIFEVKYFADVYCRSLDVTIVPTALEANYVAATGTARLSSTFYTHVKEADANLDSIVNRGGGGAKYSQARRVWILRHLAAQHCPHLQDEARVIAPHRGASVGAMRSDKLMSTFLSGIKKSTSVFERRGGGRLTNARASIRR